MAVIEMTIFMIIAFIVLPIVFGIALAKSRRIRTLFSNPTESKWHDSDIIQQDEERKEKDEKS